MNWYILISLSLLITNVLCSKHSIDSFGTVKTHGHIQDPSHILNISNKVRLSSLINMDSKLNKMLFPCDFRPDPYHVGIVVIDYARYYNYESPKKLAHDVYNKMKIGNSECDNGFLLFVSFGDGFTTIVKGKGIEDDILSEESIRLIVNYMDIDFLVGKEFSGIYNGTVLLTNHIMTMGNIVHKEYIDFVLKPINSNIYTEEDNEKQDDFYSAFIKCIVTVLLLSAMIIDSIRCYYSEDRQKTTKYEFVKVYTDGDNKKITRYRDATNITKAVSCPNMDNIEIIDVNDPDVIRKYVDVKRIQSSPNLSSYAKNNAVNDNTKSDEEEENELQQYVTVSEDGSIPSDE